MAGPGIETYSDDYLDGLRQADDDWDRLGGGGSDDEVNHNAARAGGDGGYAHSEDDEEIENLRDHSRLTFAALCDDLHLSLQSASRTEGFNLPMLTGESAGSRAAARPVLGSELCEKSLADRAGLNNSERLLYGVCTDLKLSARDASSIFKLMQNPNFRSQDVRRTDVAGINRTIITEHRQSATLECNLHTPVDGANELIFYHKNIVDCVSELCAVQELVDTMSFAPDDLEPGSEAIHGHFRNGGWWRTMANVISDAQLIPVILYSDKTFFQNTTSYPIYVTIGNIDDFWRLRCVAWRMVGLIPLYDKEKVSGLRDADVARRCDELHHQCIEVLANGMRDASLNGVKIRFWGKHGTTMRLCKPVLAMMLGDLPEQWSNCAQLQKGCTRCEITKSELHDTERAWPLKKCRDIGVAIGRATLEGVYPGWDGLGQAAARKRARETPLPLRQADGSWRLTAREEAEKALQYRTIYNQTMGFLHFDVCLQSPCDLMHGMPLGNFMHVFKACAQRIVTLIDDREPPGAALSAVFGDSCLGARFLSLVRTQTGLRKYNARHTCLAMAKEIIGGRAPSNVKAYEYDLIMLALPFLLSGIATDFAKERKCEDPSRNFQEVHIKLINLYCAARQTSFKDAEVKSLHASAIDCMETVKRYSPSRSRARASASATTSEGDDWSIAKFHLMRHYSLDILLFGSTVNTSTSAGEHAHKAMVKFAKKVTNGRVDSNKQLLNYHSRSDAANLMMLEWKDFDSDSDSSEDNASYKSRDPDAQSTQIRYPVMYCAEFKCDGRTVTLKGGGTGGIKKASIGEDSRDPARIFNVRLIKGHFTNPAVNPAVLVPDARALPRELALALRTYYAEMDLLAPEHRVPRPPTIQQLRDDLGMVCPYEGVNHAVMVFHALEMVQRRIPGKQTIRSYPFAGCTFHGNNLRALRWSAHRTRNLKLLMYSNRTEIFCMLRLFSFSRPGLSFLRG